MHTLSPHSLGCHSDHRVGRRYARPIFYISTKLAEEGHRVHQPRPPVGEGGGEREREGGREGEREREREGGREGGRDNEKDINFVELISQLYIRTCMFRKLIPCTCT